MGTTYYDREGESAFLFGGVPIHAVKRATFKDKLGTLHTLLKLVYNSVTYDFNETAQGGAVIFANNYKNWEFIAPDDRLDFEGYSSMTLGETLDDMQAVLADNPIPAWEQFACWLSKMIYTINAATSYYTVYLKNTRGTISTPIDVLTFSSMTTFSQFLDTLIAALAPASELSMANFKTSDTSFACVLSFVNPSNGYELRTMTFTFRE